MTLLKRFGLPFIITLLVAEVLARVWVAAVDPVEVSYYDAAVQLRVDALDDNDPEVIFAGTSMAWQGFVPVTFTEADEAGRSAYNLGIDGGVPQVTSAWLIDEVLPRTEPEVVVWGLSSLDFSQSFGQGAEERYRAAFETRDGIVGAIDRSVSSVSDLVRWRRVLREPAQWMSSPDRDDLASTEDMMGLGGERRDFADNKTTERAQILRSRLQADQVDEGDLEAFRRAASELEKRGIELVVVLMPVPPSFMNAHPGGPEDFQRRLEIIRDQAQSQGARVFDFSSEFGESDFVDFTHLTERAAQDFTQRFAEALAEASSSETIGTGECVLVMVEDDFGFLVEEEQCS